MLTIPIYDEAGKQTGQEQIDEQLLGGTVRPALLKQAIVMFRANQRQGHATTRSRGMIDGSTRKLYRQKGTGRARMGTVRSPIRRGGGVAFAKAVRDYRQAMPKKMRRLARRNAVLAKIEGGQVLIVDRLSFEKPQTKRFAAMLGKLNVAGTCLFMVGGQEPVLFKSGRNIPTVEIMDVAEMNAYKVLARKHLIFTKGAFELFRNGLTGAAKAEA